MDTEVSAALKDVRDTILNEMRSGFTGVYARQDKTNGRLLTVEGEVVRHDERIKTLFRKLTHRHDDGDHRQITQRDVFICIGTVSATVAILKFLPTIVRLVTP